MNTPKSPEELTAHIEQAVHGYLAAVRQAAEEAVARAFAGPALGSVRTRRAKPRAAKSAGTGRRSAEQMADLQAQLEALVRAQPGEAMTTFAAKLEMTVRELHRPMMLLKQAGRVRTVGERHLTRYFPVAGRSSAAA